MAYFKPSDSHLRGDCHFWYRPARGEPLTPNSVKEVVEAERFELSTSRTRTAPSTGLGHTPERDLHPEKAGPYTLGKTSKCFLQNIEMFFKNFSIFFKNIEMFF
jgi:hypothetical protein